MAMVAANVLVGVAVLSFKYPVGGAYVEVGYTEDGVVLEYSVEKTKIEVEEETYPIRQSISTEALKVTCNMAESSLANINIAMAGAVLAGQTITIGDGVDKEMSIKIVGTNPAGFDRTIEIPLAVAAGTVSMGWRKDEKSIVPVSFEAIKGAGALCTIVDSVA